MATGAVASVSLTGQRIGGHSRFLMFAGQQAAIGARFGIAKFNMSPNVRGTLKFAVSDGGAGCQMVSQSAWVGNGQKDADR